ncbi:BapA/Bap/LapF family large adhesin [Acinetobacter sp. B51(2017)]|uniref:BapA/Bap/LapF family large adhesin n=1 Tax=Acinetobacter sp. B51(2017) TaxID=2060938 RepID=UPI0013DF1806|nr:BapA/Bap/LapF family large adhesin [Acinetobacter sp. B51(2017)]
MNDTNENGTPDADELAAVEDLVAEAEAAYAAAEQALADALADDAVTQAEVDDLTQALADAQQVKADAQAAVDAIVDDFPTEAGDFQDRVDALTDIVIPPVTPTIDAIDDEYVLDMGQEFLVQRNPENYNDVTYIDLLGGVEGQILGANFSIPQNAADAGKARTGNITITAEQQNLASVAEAFQLVIYQNVDGVQTEVARVGAQGGVVTVGGVGVLGVVSDINSLSVTLTDLPEGEYTAVVAKDTSILSDLIFGIELDNLGGEGAILGASNETAIYNAINAVLGETLGAPIVAAVQLILIPVNTLGLPLSSVVSQLLDVLPVEVIDYIIDQTIGQLVTNTLTLYENTDLTITGTEEVFPTYTLESNVFNNNGNGVDIAPAGTIISEIDGVPAVPVNGIVTVVGDYGVLEISTTTGDFVYRVTAGEEALGKTEIFNYTIQNGTQTDTAQIIIDLAGIPFDDSSLLPPGYVDEVVANDDLATVQNYYEEPGDDIGNTGGAGQLLGIGLAGIAISVGTTTPFNFDVLENQTSDVEIVVSGVKSTTLSLSLLNTLADILTGNVLYADAVLQRQYLDENGVAQTENFVVESGIGLNATLSIPNLSFGYTYSGLINYEDLPEGVYTLSIQPQETDSTLRALIDALGSALAVDLFGGITFTVTDQTNKYLGSNEVTGNVISSNDGADVVNSTTYVKLVSNELGDPAVAIDNANTVVQGAYGTLYISPNGTYKYVSNGDIGDFGKVDTFTYTIRDFNGSSDTAQLNIRIDGENSGIVWSADPTADGVLSELELVANTDITGVPEVTNVTEVLTTSPGTFSVSGGALGLGGNGTFNSPTTNTFTVANTDSADVVLTVSMPELSVSVFPTFTLTVRDAGGAIVGTSTGTPLTGALGASRSLVIENLGPGTYTIQASATGNTGLGFTATLSLEQTLTHYNQIESLTTPNEITGNLIDDDTYLPSYSTFKVLTSQGYQEVGYNGVTIQGEYGSLFVERDGTYTYTPDNGVIGRQDTFEYSLEMFGQDPQFSTLTVTVPAITQGDGERNTLVSGESDDNFIGGLGSDVLIFDLLDSADSAGGNGQDIWSDFSSAQGDLIDITALVAGQGVTSANLSNFVSLTQQGANTVVSLDRDGSSTDLTYNRVDLVVLENTTATSLTLEELIKYNSPL